MMDDFELIDMNEDASEKKDSERKFDGNAWSDEIKAREGKTHKEDAGSSPRSRQTTAKNKKKLSVTVKRIIIFAIAEVIALAAIFSYAFVLKSYNKIQRYDIDVDKVSNINLSIESIKKMEEGYWTVAVFGVDSRDSGMGRGNNSDVIMIVNVNRQTGEIKLASVFRDTYMGIGDGSYNKINAAYCNGGPEQALKAINEDLDLNITQYVTFNWAAVATIINILGGVDIELSKAEYYYINSFITETVKGTGIGSVHLKNAGMNHLDGIQAVAYARLRLMDNDFARTERQRKVINLCFEKLKTADFQKLQEVMAVGLSMVGTNLTIDDGLYAVENMNKYHMGESIGFPQARGDANIGKITYCVIPQTLESNVRSLHQFFFEEEEYEPSDAVKAMSTKISVASSMYTPGEEVGHVSTKGYLPSTDSSKNEKKNDSEKTDENTEDTDVNEVEIIGDDDKDYAIDTNGYLVYVDGSDDDGNPTYKHVLDSDGKRIKMFTIDDDGNRVLLYEIGDDGKIHVIKNKPKVETESPADEDEEDDAFIGPGGGRPDEGDISVKPTKPSAPINHTEDEEGDSPANGPGRGEDIEYDAPGQPRIKAEEPERQERTPISSTKPGSQTEEDERGDAQIAPSKPRTQEEEDAEQPHIAPGQTTGPTGEAVVVPPAPM